MAEKTAKNLLKEMRRTRNKHLNAIGTRSTTTPVSQPQPPVASAAAGTPPLARPPPPPPSRELNTIFENNENENNNDNNAQTSTEYSPTEAQIARGLGRLPISANPYFSYDGKIIKVSSRFGDRTVYQTLSDTNTWNKEQTDDIPESELTKIECDPPIQHGGRRKRIRRTVRAKPKARPTRRLRKRT